LSALNFSEIRSFKKATVIGRAGGDFSAVVPASLSARSFPGTAAWPLAHWMLTWRSRFLRRLMSLWTSRACSWPGPAPVHDTFHSVDVLLEVIAPEAITYLIASKLGIQYDKTLDTSKRRGSFGIWRDGRRNAWFLERRRICTYIQLLD